MHAKALGATMDSSAIPDRVGRPLYSYADADRLAGVSRGTSKRWISGYRSNNALGERVEYPPITPDNDALGAVSFVELIEIVAIGRLKESRFSIKRIRQIVEQCQSLLKVPRPLAMLSFKFDGRDIFVNKGETLLGLGKNKGQQAWNDLLSPFLEELDYTGSYASRWWPLGRDKPIIIDPDYGYGLPVIENSGIRTETILERFNAGELAHQIAEDFNLNTMQVERALLFESNHRVA